MRISEYVQRSRSDESAPAEFLLRAEQWLGLAAIRTQASDRNGQRSSAMGAMVEVCLVDFAAALDRNSSEHSGRPEAQTLKDECPHRSDDHRIGARGHP